MKAWFAGLVMLSVCAAFPLAGPAEEKQPFFTNEDVNKYRKTPDARTALPKGDSTITRKETAGTAKDRHEQERWCRQGSERKKKIEMAQYDVHTAQQNLLREKEKSPSGSKKNRQLQKSLDRAQRRLSIEEKELYDLESEAHRKGVPPGWLRCQFE